MKTQFIIIHKNWRSGVGHVGVGCGGGGGERIPIRSVFHRKKK